MEFIDHAKQPEPNQAEPNQAPVPASESGAAEPEPVAEPGLPTLADLRTVSADLDDIDEVLARLDQTEAEDADADAEPTSLDHLDQDDDADHSNQDEHLDRSEHTDQAPPAAGWSTN